MANLSHLSRVLVVEDEGLILLDIEQTLRDAGVGDVLLASTAADALRMIDAVGFDAAVLDLHLGRSGWNYDTARRLVEKGVPFIFSSGTIDVADGFRNVPLVMKPCSSNQLVAALLQVTADRQLAAAQ